MNTAINSEPFIFYISRAQMAELHEICKRAGGSNIVTQMSLNRLLTKINSQTVSLTELKGKE